ncbi:MAG: NFACT family protein, partial [Desulfurococcales archaeon]|nr:NFACT family protein [Desulfurococcales archaeon]
LNLTPSQLADLLEGQKDLVRGLVRAAKLPGEYAEEAIHRANLQPGAKPKDLAPGDLEALIEAIQGIWRESLQGKGYLAPSRGEATPFKPTRLPPGEVVEHPTFDDALDELYSTPAQPVDTGERERLLKSLEEARETARRYAEEAEKLRRAASLIPSMYDEIQSILDCAATGGQCPGVDRKRGIVEIPVGDTIVKARIGETVDQLVLRLFREAGELEAKARRAREAEKSIMERLEDLELKVKARRVAALARARRRQWYEKYHWTITRSGLIAVGGRDAGQNEAVVKRYLGESDIFMHADIHGAPAVVLKTEGREPTTGDLMDAAVIAAAYSRAWKAGLGHVQVYWVHANQVSKSPPTGEYLARGGFIIRGKKNYLPPVRTRLYLGLAQDQDGAPYILAGSREAVEPRVLAYLELEPGDLKVEEAARRIKQELAKTLPRDARHIALGLPEEEVAQRLPGRIRILSARRGGATPVQA